MEHPISTRPVVLVIDSGIGGLSICQSILASPAHADIRYLADNAAFPYGSKSDKFLISRLETLIKKATDLFPVDMIVLACNTISTLVLPRLRALFEVPIVGVVPAIKPAAALSRSKVIGLLATPGTVRREYTDQLVNDFASHCQVISIGSTVLVEQAELFLMDERVDAEAVSAELDAFVNSKLGVPDTIVLGCTHFPFLTPFLRAALPNVQWVDSGEAIARRVCSLLDGHHTMSREETSHSIFFTGAVPASEHFRKRLLQIGFSNVQVNSFTI